MVTSSRLQKQINEINLKHTYMYIWYLICSWLPKNRHFFGIKLKIFALSDS